MNLKPSMNLRQSMPRKQSLKNSLKRSVKAVNVALSVVLLLSPLSVPAHADFKYTDSTKMTGGSLYGLMKFAARFSKKGQNPLDPVVTSHYIKGGRLRTDNSDGTVMIIDLEGRRIININTMQKTYSTATFDEIKAAAEQAMQQMQQQMQQAPKAQPDANPQNVQVNLTPKFDVTPGAGNRVILGVPTNETIMHMDLNVAATATPEPGDTTASGQPVPSGPQTVNGTMTMTVDMFMAPTVPGYQEIGEFYRRMAQEINWVPPSNIHVDPRVSQGLTELQKNSAEFKGLPMLETISMGMSIPPGQQTGQPAESTQETRSNSSRPSNTSSRNDDIPTTPSAAIVKGLGGMFSKKKQADNPPPQSSGSSGPAAAPNADNSQPTSATLMEMTTEVTSFSTSSLDSSIFEVPAGYTQVQAPQGQFLGGRGGGPPQK
jgi:hypothetical protein